MPSILVSYPISPSSRAGLLRRSFGLRRHSEHDSGGHRRERAESDCYRDGIEVVAFGTVIVRTLRASVSVLRIHAEPRVDVFVGTIIEGPFKWKVRPVAEVSYEKESGLEETVSGLLGLIWQVSDKLSFDVAFRHALTCRE
jgi:hypothetical protein